MRKLIAFMLVALIILTSLPPEVHAASSAASLGALDNDKLIDLALSDEIASYDFSWQNDLGFDQQEFSSFMKDIGFIYAYDKLFSYDRDIWEASIIRIFHNDAASKIIAYKEMQKAVDLMLLPDPKELEMNQLFALNQYQLIIDAFKDTHTVAKNVTKPLSTYLATIKSIRDNCINTGQLEKAAQANSILQRYSFSVKQSDRIKNISKGLGKGLAIADLTSKTAGEALKAIAISDSANTRFEQFINLVDTRYKNPKYGAEDEWDYAIKKAAEVSIDAYYKQNIISQINKFVEDIKPSFDKTLFTIIDFKNVPGGIWSFAKVRGDVGGAVVTSEKLMSALATYFLQDIAREEYYKTLKEVKQSIEPDEEKLNKLRQAGLLYLRSSIQTRNLVAEGYDKLKDYTTSGTVVSELRRKNDAAYVFLIKWQNALLNDTTSYEVQESWLNNSDAPAKVFNWLVKDDRQGKSFTGIGHLNDKLVAVGANGLIMVSGDKGSNWSKVESNTREKFIGVASDGKRLVAATNRGSVFTTTDGLTWTSNEWVAHSEVNAIVYVNGKFAMLGDEFTILLSSDGIDWTQVSRHYYRKQHFDLFDMVYNTVKGEWIIAASNWLLTTKDFVKYDKYELPQDCYMRSLGWVGDKLCIASSYGYTYQTENYIRFTTSSKYSSSSGFSQNFNKIITFKEKFCVFGQYGESYYGSSVNDLEKKIEWWNTQSKDLSDVDFVDNTFYAVTASGSIEKTYNPGGLWEWQTVLDGDTQSIRDILVTPEKRFIAITGDSRIFLSDDNYSFKQVEDLQRSSTCITYNTAEGKYTIKGSSHFTAKSEDGVNWEYYEDSSNDYVIRDVVYFNDRLYVLDGSNEYGVACYVEKEGYKYIHKFNQDPSAMTIFDKGKKLIAAGQFGEAVIIDKSNTVKKVNINGENTRQIRDVNERLVAIHVGGKISVSDNGVTWETIMVDPAESFFDIAYGGGRYVLVGRNGRILSSFDLKNWYINDSKIGNDLYNIAFNGRVFVVTGGENSILVSDTELAFTSNNVDNTPPKLVDFSGTYEVEAGEIFVIPGKVISNTTIKRITLGVIGYYDSYDFRIPEIKTYELSSFVIDTSVGDLSKPGRYEINVWVKTEGYRNPKNELGRLTLIVTPKRGVTQLLLDDATITADFPRETIWAGDYSDDELVGTLTIRNTGKNDWNTKEYKVRVVEYFNDRFLRTRYIDLGSKVRTGERITIGITGELLLTDLSDIQNKIEYTMVKGNKPFGKPITVFLDIVPI